ncbi:phosphoethanolamine transferase [Variovorax ginsengisoli]|uniref:Heptose-I-phosphate ethanolaminephosphotransferase n=1 Tax=Variovorax ginsengisoli TaxID=363844 RepID=A0ABT9S3X0_9BURK|nr:phosphoethanolamine transferase [Variovorax ginsengisoli]MDP9899039.1 heptose-I-phosphate ethanolaminephosphotransferase [Variovorax ginsengisoli]
MAHRTGALAACAAVFCIMLLLTVLGHDGKRVAQLMVLALPGIVWLAWPIQNSMLHRFRTAAVWLWALAFMIDGALRAYLLDAYQAAPDSSVVLTAIANTNDRESTEYLHMHWRTLAVWCVVLCGAAAATAWAARQGLRAGLEATRWHVVLVCAVLLLTMVAYASKPWRRLHPVLFWSHWHTSLSTLRAGWTGQQAQRDAALVRARQASPVVLRAGPSTIVLVITDSINRDNLSLYGYGRATTPRLQTYQRQLGNQMVVMRNAWSVDASTLPALRNMFGFGAPDAVDAQHALALARAAGYKVWWMSNHDDVAIEQQHGRMADVFEMVNRVPGRASASLDGELIDCLQEAMEDPAERKLIVVHLMGAHPHYNLRFPAGDNPFDHTDDDVEALMKKHGRSSWTREFRQSYDAALLYHDFVVSETLQLARTAGTPGGHRAWMYLSDHGQEVGHESDRAGHSPATASGYRIPAVVWRNDPASAAESLNQAIQQQPFRSDWAAYMLMNLLDIQWAGAMPQRNALSADYRWQAPHLPVQVPSFTD